MHQNVHRLNAQINKCKNSAITSKRRTTVLPMASVLFCSSWCVCRFSLQKKKKTLITISFFRQFIFIVLLLICTPHFFSIKHHAKKRLMLLFSSSQNRTKFPSKFTFWFHKSSTDAVITDKKKNNKR